MGNKGDMEARYTTNKRRLPDEVIEDMLRSFRDCEEYVSTRMIEIDDAPEVTTIRTMVETEGFDLEKPNVRSYLI